MKTTSRLCLLLAAGFASAAALGQTPGIQVKQGSALFDVRDLLRPTPQFSAPVLGVPKPARAATTAQPAPRKADKADAALDAFGYAAGADPERERALLESGEVLTSLARGFIQPPLEADSSQLSFLPGSTLLLQGKSEQIDWLKGFLAQQRFAEERVEVRTTLLRLPVRMLAVAKLAHGQTIPNLAELDKLLAQIEAVPGCEQINSSRVQMFLLQRVCLAVTDQVGYIEDWSVQLVGSDRQEIADPQIAILDEGIALEVSAARLDELRHGLLVHVQHVKVEQPISTKKVSIGSAGAQVEVHLPKVKRIELRSALELEQGASAVLLFHHDAEQVFVAIVTLESVSVR